MKGNRIYLLCATLITILLFFLFKLVYPHPNMVLDSYVYIRPLVEGGSVNSFPMGYTWFLQLFSFFSRSATLLVWVQYLLMEGSCLLFFFTLLHFFQPGKWTKLLLFLFLFVNPLFLYISNFIMSDPLFTTLSILWLTQLIWLIGRPRPYMILVHAVLLLMVFTVRYTALYYPLVASLGLLFTRLKPWQKLTAIGLQFLLIGVFVAYTTHQMKELTGVPQFSPFGGWRMANNALYMYGHVCLEEKDPVPAKFAVLDQMVKGYFNAVRRVDDLSDPRSGGAFYAGDDKAPLMQYMRSLYGTDTAFLDLKKFTPLAPLYSAYGSYLARKYPLDYCRWFLWPSAVRYAIVPKEIFSTLDPFLLKQDGIGKETSQWFGIKTLEVSPAYIDLQSIIISPYPILLGLIHLAFILGLLGFMLFGGFKKMGRVNGRVIMVIVAFWICDLLFKVTAGAVVLRHQLFLMILEFAFATQFIGWLYHQDSLRPYYFKPGVLK